MTSQTGTAVKKSIVLTTALVSSFILPFQLSAVNIALPTMARDFNMEAAVMSWVNTSYLLALAIFQVPFGRLADIYGRKKFFLIGLILSAVSAFIGGVANSIPMVMFSRVLQGIGAGMTYSTAMSMITSVFSGAERSKAIGINQSGTYIGLSVGPFLGGLITEHLGWQSIFLISGGLTALLVILILVGMKGEWAEARGEKFDIIGSITFGFSLALFMYGFTELPTLNGIIFIIVGIAGLLFFGWYEMRLPSPVFDFSLFQNNRVFIFCNIAALVTYISTFAVTFLLSLYMQYIKAYSVESAGLVVVASSVLMAIIAFFSGYISQRFGARQVATAGMVLNFAAAVLFIFLGNATPVWYVILGLAFFGMGTGLFSSPNTNALVESVSSRVLGVASGMLGTMRNTGMVLSMGIITILFSVYIGQAEITPAYYPQFLDSVHTGFIIFSITGFIGVIAQYIARPKITKSAPR